MYDRKIDLHGFDRDYARIKTLEFINDSYREGVKTIRIIHGNGTGVLKKEVSEILKNNRLVEKYSINMFNAGETLVTLKNKK